MGKPDWNEAPMDATHFHPRAILAKWYKMIDGIWHYHYSAGVWKKSTGLPDVVDFLESRP